MPGVLMSRSPSTSTSDPSLNKLVRKALLLVKRRTTREQMLVEALQNQHSEANALVTAVAPGGAIPRSVEEALRSPVGQDRVVVVEHDGIIITALLHSLGRHAPDREEAVWRCLLDQAVTVREEWRP